jgi:hypothetical protein
MLPRKQKRRHGKMVKHGDIVTLSKKELQQIIQRECKERLGLSYDEFMRKRASNQLPKSTAVHDIELLLALA